MQHVLPNAEKILISALGDAVREIARTGDSSGAEKIMVQEYGLSEKSAAIVLSEFINGIHGVGVIPSADTDEMRRWVRDYDPGAVARLMSVVALGMMKNDKISGAMGEMYLNEARNIRKEMMAGIQMLDDEIRRTRIPLIARALAIGKREIEREAEVIISMAGQE